MPKLKSRSWKYDYLSLEVINDIADECRQIREELGLSRAQVGEAIGVPHWQIRDFEYGHSRYDANTNSVKWEILEKLVNYYHLKIEVKVRTAA